MRLSTSRYGTTGQATASLLQDIVTYDSSKGYLDESVQSNGAVFLKKLLSTLIEHYK